MIASSSLHNLFHSEMHVFLGLAVLLVTHRVGAETDDSRPTTFRWLDNKAEALSVIHAR